MTTCEEQLALVTFLLVLGIALFAYIVGRIDGRRKENGQEVAE